MMGYDTKVRTNIVKPDTKVQFEHIHIEQKKSLRVCVRTNDRQIDRQMCRMKEKMKEKNKNENKYKQNVCV